MGLLDHLLIDQALQNHAVVGRQILKLDAVIEHRFAAAILVVPRFGRYLSRRRAFRLGLSAPIVSGAIVSDAYLNPEVVQTVWVD